MSQGPNINLLFVKTVRHNWLYTAAWIWIIITSGINQNAFKLFCQCFHIDAKEMCMTYNTADCTVSLKKHPFNIHHLCAKQYLKQYLIKWNVTSITFGYVEHLFQKSGSQLSFEVEVSNLMHGRATLVHALFFPWWINFRDFFANCQETLAWKNPLVIFEPLHRSYLLYGHLFDFITNYFSFLFGWQCQEFQSSILISFCFKFWPQHFVNRILFFFCCDYSCSYLAFPVLSLVLSKLTFIQLYMDSAYSTRLQRLCLIPTVYAWVIFSLRMGWTHFSTLLFRENPRSVF